MSGKQRRMRAHLVTQVQAGVQLLVRLLLQSRVNPQWQR
jgi:hypothetical protein